MIKKIFTYLKNTIIGEYKFIIFLVLLYIILQWPLNYYIITGGGSSDVSSRISVEDKYNSKGSFNISYVSELKGTVLTYLLSYVVPSWERESADEYKYSTKESIDDIEFRSDLDLLTSNGTATYWAYKLANKEVEEIESKLYVIIVYDGFETNLKVGDEVLSINDKTYDTVNKYRDYMQTLHKDDEVKVIVKRNNSIKEVKTKLHENKDRLVLGVGLQYVRKYKTNPKVEIKFRNSESGPSGGLISTLEIYNQLTKKDLTKGKKIVGTGTIEEDGAIGQIGGVEHKLLGAVQAKADIFLVPDGKNYEEALKYKKDKNLKIKIINVKTIEEAITKLEDLK